MAQRHRVLILEDEPDIRDSIAEVLAAEGYAVEVASNGIEGLAVAEAFRPDLIVLDLMLPGMDGLEFLDAKRWIPWLAQVPVIVETARHPAPEVGCEILYKPFDLDDLIAAASRCLTCGNP